MSCAPRVMRKRDRHQQTCKCCGLPDKFNFDVPDEIWSAVVPKALQNRVVCLSCFDDFARERGIDYGPSLSVLHFAGNQAAFEFNVAWAVPVEHTEAFQKSHPEDTCQQCHGPNVVWSAPTALWNRVVGSPNGILCPMCFMLMAQAKGIGGTWRLFLGLAPE